MLVLVAHHTAAVVFNAHRVARIREIVAFRPVIGDIFAELEKRQELPVLLTGWNPLTHALLQAFAEPDSLGVIAVDGIMDLQQSRAALLPLAAQLAALPEQVLSSLEHPKSNYLIGWSRGKEILANGEPDTNKGSFYANPLVDKRWQSASSTSSDTAAGDTGVTTSH